MEKVIARKILLHAAEYQIATAHTDSNSFFHDNYDYCHVRFAETKAGEGFWQVFF